MGTIDHKSRSPSPRVIETSPVTKQSRPIASIDYNESLVEHLKREMSEPKFSPRHTKSFAPSPALMNSAKKQDRELSSWLYNTVSPTQSKVQPPYGILELHQNFPRLARAALVRDEQ